MWIKFLISVSDKVCLTYYLDLHLWFSISTIAIELSPLLKFDIFSCIAGTPTNTRGDWRVNPAT